MLRSEDDVPWCGQVSTSLMAMFIMGFSLAPKIQVSFPSSTLINTMDIPLGRLTAVLLKGAVQGGSFLECAKA